MPTYPEGDVSNTAGGTYVERQDVVLLNGQTRSKFYSSERFVDNAFYCATDSGKTIHACCKTGSLWVSPPSPLPFCPVPFFPAKGDVDNSLRILVLGAADPDSPIDLGLRPDARATEKSSGG